MIVSSGQVDRRPPLQPNVAPGAVGILRRFRIPDPGAVGTLRVDLQDFDSGSLRAGGIRCGFETSPMPLNAETLYSSRLVTIQDVVCSERCGNGRHEEQCLVATIALVRSGAFVRRDRMGIHVADATRVVFFDPAEPYMVDHPVPGGDRCTVLKFDARTLRESARPARGEPERVFDRATLAGTAELHLAHREMLNGVRERDGVLVEETALRLLQLCTEGEPASAPLRGAAARKAAMLAADAQVLIAARHSEKVTLDELARQLHVSPFRLCRAYRMATGGTLHRHLTDLRLAAALEKLPEYRSDLSALAFDLGFSSHSHFTHAFRSYYGRAPAAWLQAYRS
jgi:AraC-like DNA-binding protein